MKTLFGLAAFGLFASISLQAAAAAHGGTYRGPGNTQPPSQGPADTAPGGGSSSGGSSGGNQGPSTAGGQSGGKTSGGNKSPGGGGSSMPSGPMQAEWEPWWAFNRDPFLNLKAVIHDGDLVLGSDNYFLGHAPLELVRDRLRPSDEVIRDEIVPALLNVLATESDNDLVTGAQVALAKIGDRAGGEQSNLVVERLTGFLSSSNQEIAETAAVSLGIHADPRSLEILHELLYDTDRGHKLVGAHEVHWRTRAFAAYGLGLVGYRSTDPVVRRRVVLDLTEALDGPVLRLPTPDIAVACLTALGLVPLSEDPNCMLLADERLVATHCRRGQLRWLMDFSARPKLNYMVQAHVPTAIARLVASADFNLGMRKEAAATLIALATARSGQSELRASAIQALGAIGNSGNSVVDRELRATLIKLAREAREPETRTLALIAVGQAGGRRRGVEPDDTQGLDEVRQFLTERFSKGRSSDRPFVALALALLERHVMDAGLSGSDATMELLQVAFVGAKTPREVGAFGVSLGVMRDSDSAPALIKKLSEISDDRARGYICIGLGLMNSRESVDPLRDLLANSRYRTLLMREVAISLGLLGDKDVVDELVMQLHAATSLTAQSSIASALGTIGDARSIPPLLEMLQDQEINVRARAFAAVALGIVSDKEPLPWNAKIAVGVNYKANPPTLTDGQGTGILDIL
jgi:HEAT repeat protein